VYPLRSLLFIAPELGSEDDTISQQLTVKRGTEGAVDKIMAGVHRRGLESELLQ
jgi:hypothetical protein